ncbi:unnamed protein product [Chrysoparadoxa australica]
MEENTRMQFELKYHKKELQQLGLRLQELVQANKALVEQLVQANISERAEAKKSCSLQLEVSQLLQRLTLIKEDSGVELLKDHEETDSELLHICAQLANISPKERQEVIHLMAEITAEAAEVASLNHQLEHYRGCGEALQRKTEAQASSRAALVKLVLAVHKNAAKRAEICEDGSSFLTDSHRSRADAHPWPLETKLLPMDLDDLRPIEEQQVAAKLLLLLGHAPKSMRNRPGAMLPLLVGDRAEVEEARSVTGIPSWEALAPTVRTAKRRSTRSVGTQTATYMEMRGWHTKAAPADSGASVEGEAAASLKEKCSCTRLIIHEGETLPKGAKMKQKAAGSLPLPHRGPDYTQVSLVTLDSSRDRELLRSRYPSRRAGRGKTRPAKATFLGERGPSLAISSFSALQN